jgi:hypothetical protein
MSGEELAKKIREWDAAVEADESSDWQEATRKPFDGGIMLAVANVLESWDDLGAPGRMSLADAVNQLQETAEQVIA